jgi:hypothetical protein
MSKKRTYLAGFATAIAAVCVCGGTSYYRHRILVHDGAPPTCTVATGDGDVCIEDALEVQGNAAITGTLTQTGATTFTGAATFSSTATVEGDLTCTGGAGALTFDGGDETILLKDNDSTSLDIGATGATNMIRFDTTDSSEQVEFYVDINPTSGAGAITFDAGDETIVLKDNDSTSLDIGAAGATNMIRFDTTDSSEQVEFNVDINPTSGAGAITFDGGDETIVLADNDSTSLDIGSAGTTNLLRFDTTNSAEGVIVGGYVDMGTKYLAAMLGEIRFCGQGSNGATANYVGPQVEADMDTDLTYGSAGCDGKDSTTEATADLVYSPGFDFKPVAIMCSVDDGGTDDDLVFQLRDDTADVSNVTCTITLDGSGFDVCTATDPTPETVAAASAIAVKITATDDDCSGCDVECRVYYTY